MTYSVAPDDQREILRNIKIYLRRQGLDEDIETVLETLEAYAEITRGWHEDPNLEAVVYDSGVLRNLITASRSLLTRIDEFLFAEYGRHVEPTAASALWGPALDCLRKAFSDQPIIIYTTNYDRVIETACTDLSLSLWNYFVNDAAAGASKLDLAASPASLNGIVILLKLHGSIYWHEFDGLVYQVPRASPALEPETTTLIRPTRVKLTTQYPFRDMYAMFATTLASARVLLVIGHSLRDEMVRTTIRDATATNPELRIFVVDPATRDPLFLSGLSSKGIDIGDSFTSSPFGPDIVDPLQAWLERVLT